MSGRSIRLIDKTELLRTLEQDINVTVTGQENMEAVKRCLQEVLDDVRNSPEVDAVPVVRCKDCKHGQDRVNGRIICFYLDCLSVEDDWYCADAERKEE